MVQAKSQISNGNDIDDIGNKKKKQKSPKVVDNRPKRPTHGHSEHLFNFQTDKNKKKERQLTLQHYYSDNWACENVYDVPEYVYKNYNLDRNFYKKFTHAYGIPVLGSDKVTDAAMKRACYTVRFMLADREDLREAQAGFPLKYGFQFRRFITE